MRRFTDYLLFLLFNLISIKSYALHIKPVADNQTITAKIAAKELTRIFVEGDRIQSIHGVEGAYIFKSDANQGALYIKPSEAYQQQAFNIFITTEQGHNFTLFLIPSSIPAETIQIKPLSVSKQVAERWEKANTYSETLITLISHMANNTIPEGYVVSTVTKAKMHDFLPQIKWRLIKVYRGVIFQGSVFELTNTSSSSITIDERQFYQPGVRAVALQKQTVEPFGSILIYRVYTNDIR
jgi:conjugal transfer pilus assembly protein TraK